MTALHNFFAQSLPLLHVYGETNVEIVDDNAKGLTKESAFSERRRQYDAHFASPNASRSKVSRWESELPALLAFSNSPPAPQRRESGQVAALPETLAAPQIPRRRSSVEEDYCTNGNEAEETSHSRGSQSSNSSRSSRSCGSEGSADTPLAPPRRRTSCLAWLDEVESNDLLVINNQSNQIPETKLQSRSSTKTHRDLLVHMDAQISKNNPKGSSRKARTKNAPRRPRRMKSMDQDDFADSSGPHHDSNSTSTHSTAESSAVSDESSLRLALSGSIHSVMEQVKKQTSDQEQAPSTHKLTPSEQIVLKDAVRGVVGALSRRSSRRNVHETTTKKGRQGSPNRRESPPHTGEVRMANTTTLGSY